ncbi:MAG: hypothetical protein LBP35_01315 [Candidatus Ancillula trichonymphae]|jgi:UDP-N-acetylmuramoylalanine--D-glutamate ligase|nr:hypothetical protein [Candidatus Ancillula trichonymphae]
MADGYEIEKTTQRFISTTRNEQLKFRSRFNTQLELIKSGVDNYATSASSSAEKHDDENCVEKQNSKKNALEVQKQFENFEPQDKRILLLGLDSAGKRILEHLQNMQLNIRSFDELAEEADLRSRNDLRVTDFDLIITTSAFDPQDSIIQEALTRGVVVWSELELAWHLRSNNSGTLRPTPWIGITGTSGKSTTIEICKLMFEQTRFDVQVAAEGNILDAVFNEHLDFVIIEVSSFLLQFAYNFSFEVSVILNIDEDHINWHGSPDEYVRVKSKIFNNTLRSSCIFNADGADAHRIAQEADVLEGARAIGFTHHSPGRSMIGQVAGLVTDRVFYEDNADPLRYLYANEVVDLDKFPHLQNPVGQAPSYLVDDIVAAVAAARTYGVDAHDISAAIEEFKYPKSSNQLIYRRELKKEVEYGVGSIYYVDNTNSNNSYSAESVMKTYPPKSVVWISGGGAKGANYNPFVTRVAPYISAVIIIGDETDMIWRALRKYAVESPAYKIEPQPFCDAVTRALEKADELVFENQTILLSPASGFKCGTQEDLVEQLRVYVGKLMAKVPENAVRRGF